MTPSGRGSARCSRPRSRRSWTPSRPIHSRTAWFSRTSARQSRGDFLTASSTGLTPIGSRSLPYSTPAAIPSSGRAEHDSCIGPRRAGFVPRNFNRIEHGKPSVPTIEKIDRALSQSRPHPGIALSGSTKRLTKTRAHGETAEVASKATERLTWLCHQTSPAQTSCVPLVVARWSHQAGRSGEIAVVWKW